jgi:hypothetical protein
MNSVHFCSITHKSNQMHYFYYLKLEKNIYVYLGQWTLSKIILV